MAKKIGKMSFPLGGTQLERIAEAFRQLGLSASATSFEFLAEKMIKEHWSPYDFLERLLEHEYIAKEEARVNRWFQQSKIPTRKRIEEYEFEKQPSVDPILVNDLRSCRYIETGKNVILLGDSGVGKSHLAQALGNDAIDIGLETRYMTDIEFGAVVNRANGSISRLHRSLMRPKLLILDDIDHFNTNEESGKFLYDLLKQRYELKLSVIITSNNHLDDWGDLFGNPKRNKPIIDRLLDHKRRVLINIDGPSYRVPEPPVPSKAEVKRSTITEITHEHGLLRKIGSALSQRG